MFCDLYLAEVGAGGEERFLLASTPSTSSLASNAHLSRKSMKIFHLLSSQLKKDSRANKCKQLLWTNVTVSELLQLLFYQGAWIRSGRGTRSVEWPSVLVSGEQTHQGRRPIRRYEVLHLKKGSFLNLDWTIKDISFTIMMIFLENLLVHQRIYFKA